ncbi:MAG: alpha/beta hydrolase [Hyphomicrobiaceae bacterium]
MVASIGVLIALGLFALWYFQRRLIYQPDVRRVLPKQIGLSSVNEVILERPDGASIVCWYGQARPAQPTLLYFHGNGGNLAGRAERVSAYRKRGRGLLMMSYRGYSGSTSDPTERRNVGDALAAYDFLRDQGVDANDILVYGESLGSGVAVHLATKRHVGAVILDAPFTSLPDVGTLIYPYLPVHLAIRDRYNSIGRIGRIEAPLLIVHGGRDRIVPFRMGRSLFEAANEPKTFAAFPLAGHSDHYQFGSYQKIEAWIDDLRVAAAEAAQ